MGSTSRKSRPGVGAGDDQKTRKAVGRVTAQQQRFVTEYLVDCNATQAAIRAGYSAKTARAQGQRLLTIVDIQNAIQAGLERLQRPAIASAEEVMEYLTRVMRDETTEEALVTEAMGDGVTEARRMDKRVPARERVRAAELMAKRYGLFAERVVLEEAPVIRDDIPDA